MDPTVGTALTQLESALNTFRAELEPIPEIHERVFDDAQEWLDLLVYKLIPHLSGEGCLVVAVAGGTNTGKSTVFNLLTHQVISPMVNTAAATCHPVVAAGTERTAECLEGKLIPEFLPVPLGDAADAVDSSISFRTVFVHEVSSIPHHLVIMDTPDVDSIDKRNWEVADHIRAAGDVLVAVMTGEKYKDNRVVEFFREAAASGRVIIPIMNKANPADDFDVARKQLAEFQSDVGFESPCFVIAHDFDIGENVNRSIEGLDGTAELRTYIEELDVQEIKDRVFQQTVEHFASNTKSFLENAQAVHSELSDVVEQFEHLVLSAVEEYEPAPGKEVGGLFHEFVQAKRGTLRRWIGSTSSSITKGAAAVGRGLTSGFRKRASLEVEEKQTEEALVEFHQNQIRRIVQKLITQYIEAARTLGDPVQKMVLSSVEELDTDSIIEQVVEDTLKTDNISDEFRVHAQQMLDSWWDEHKTKRMALEALDTGLAVMPAAIAGVTTVFTGGLGAGEVALASTAAGATFSAKVIELQFGDKMFDFISPWKKEQLDFLNQALLEHIVTPSLQTVYDARDPFENHLGELESCQVRLTDAVEG